MASTKPSSSDNAKELKKLQKNIKLMNHQLRLKVDKAYVSKSNYRSDSSYGLEEKINRMIIDRDELKADKLVLKAKKLKLKNKELELMKKNDKLESQKQNLKAKIQDLKTAYHDLIHAGKNVDYDSFSCGHRCCESSSEDSFDEGGYVEDSSDED
ncbi:hypothetical protein KCU99_g5737, partial [Aureobasidium melanogenum]